MAKNVRLGLWYAAGEVLRQGYRLSRQQLRRVVRLIDPVGNMFEAEWGASGRVYSSDGMEFAFHINTLMDAFSKMMLSAKVTTRDCWYDYGFAQASPQEAWLGTP